MNALDIMKRPAAYVSGYENTPTENRTVQSNCAGSTTAPLLTNGKAAQYPADPAGHLLSHDRH